MVLKQHREAQDADRALLETAYRDSDLVFAKADGSVVKPAAYGKAVLELLRRCDMENVTLHSLRDTRRLAACGGRRADRGREQAPGSLYDRRDDGAIP